MVSTKQKFLAIFLFLALVAGTLALWRMGVLSNLYAQERLVSDLRGAGLWGPLLCMAIQFVQVVIFFIPGEFTQFAAGYVFGAGPGFLYSIAGIMLGSAFDFYFARVAGRPMLERILRPERLEKLDAAVKSARGKAAIFLLFLAPGAPKDAMSYAAGLSDLGLGEFILLSGLARTPALLVSVLLGAQTARKEYRAMTITILLTAAIFLAYYLFYRRQRARGAHT